MYTEVFKAANNTYTMILNWNSQIYFAFAFPITTDKHTLNFVQI